MALAAGLAGESACPTLRAVDQKRRNLAVAAVAPNPECATGACEAAIERLEALILRLPHDYTALYQLGVCYAGVCRSHPLVHPGIAAEYLRHSLSLAGEQPGVRAAILDQLGHTLLQLGDPAALRSAIECHSEAAGLYHSRGMAEDGSRTEYNLGNSNCELSELTGEDHWSEAIRHYKAALSSPERRVAVLTNLATAYRQVNDISSCIRCYRRALATKTVRTNPAK
jgi:tetratricopeptide (TPR) repeat protein